jgi:hypothetical protein
MASGMSRDPAGTVAGRVRAVWRRLEVASRPAAPETAAALARRWAGLPEAVRTPGQALGRQGVGCEGTHGVFPRCNLSCRPCYHSAEANKVRVDGDHTVAEVTRQMAHLQAERGPHAHAQLIGGEVSLLEPDDHAAALAAMRAHGREPMSFTHGDFDYDYLKRLALGPDGRPRFPRLSFAVHFDSMMRGRRGAPRPRTEAELDPYRAGFCGQLARLRREHGVGSYAAHNMTVTPANIEAIPEVIRNNRHTGFAMFSFQPAAYVGDERRWREEYRAISDDDVWAAVEAGAGARLPYRAIQVGDFRCNRAAFGLQVDDEWVPLMDEERPIDLALRDALFRHLPGMTFTGAPIGMVALRLARVVVTHPSALATAVRWLSAVLRRAGGLARLARAAARGRLRPITFTMHSFIDAELVQPAWEALQRGERSDEPEIRAAQERLQACTYSMAHPETGELVPACVQHSVLDAGENVALRTQLPIVEVRSTTGAGVRDAGA